MSCTTAASFRSCTRRARRSRSAWPSSPSWSWVSSLCSSTSRSIATSHARSSASASLACRSAPSVPCRASPSLITRSTIFRTRCWIGAHWSVAAAGAERADRERHRRVRPLRGAALLPVRGRASGADVREELLRGGGARGLGERPADIDSGVVIGPSDGGSPVGLDVHERRKIEFLGPRPVARLPDREQLGQAPPVARGERRGDGVEGMSERGRDLVVVQVRGARLDVVAVGLQPFVIVRGDAVTEDVHGLSLAFERRGQLLGDERVGQVAERQDHRRSCRDR